MIGYVWQDLRYGLRMLAKKPGFTLVAVITLALGIGANTALFSVVDAVLLKKLLVKEPDRLVLFRWLAGNSFRTGLYRGAADTDPATGLRSYTSFRYQALERLRGPQRALSDIFAFASLGQVSVSADGQADMANGQLVSGNYFTGLGVPALLGRTLLEEDDKAAASPVAVLGYNYWQRRFGGDPAVVGKQISINNVAFTVVGVTPPGFKGTMQVGASLDVSVPLASEPQVRAGGSFRNEPTRWWLLMMGRLRPGATAEQARASLAGIFQQVALEHQPSQAQPLAPADYPRLVLDPGGQGQMEMRRSTAPQLFLLQGVVGLVLLIACANVANLLLARATGRQKEIAVRLALGASRWRLIRQLLTESITLSVLGGALGTLFALWLKDALLAVGEWRGWQVTGLEPALELRVLAFTAALSVLTGILFGLAPAFRATRVDLTPALKDSARSAGSARSRLSQALVVLQVALSLLLLIGAGLLLRTLRNLERIEAGFNRHNLLVFGVDPRLNGYQDERLVNLYKQMLERLEAVPGLRSVTITRDQLLTGGASGRNIYLPGAAPAAGEQARAGQTQIHRVRENYFATMEIPILLGRGLSPQDDERAPRVVVVNQAFAQRYFPNESPVGKRFGFAANEAARLEIVGVTRDAKYTTLREEIGPTVYIPWLQERTRMGQMYFAVRTAGEPGAYLPAIRQAVRELDSNVPLLDPKTQVEQSDQSLSLEYTFVRLLSFFGLLALLLAAIGLYGVMAYAVTRRTREFGIRMALGAQVGDVLRLIIRQGMILTLLGVVIGWAASFALTRLMASMLYGVSATDPLTFSVIALLLISVALLACWIPARRATKVDPGVALRYE